MGQQLGMLLKVACVAVNGLGLLRGLEVYSALPVDAMVPMKFGLFGEVRWCLRGSLWALSYPALCVCMGLTPFLPHDWPTAGWEPDGFRAAAEAATDATCLLTGGLMLLITEQIPRLVNHEQQGLVPSKITLCCLEAKIQADFS